MSDEASKSSHADAGRLQRPVGRMVPKRIDGAIEIDQLVAEHEREPRKAAAMARARERLRCWFCGCDLVVRDGWHVSLCRRIHTEPR